MTPEERARRVIENVALYSHVASGEEMIAAAIREAVAEEREACAVIAEEARGAGGWATCISMLIRARETP